MQISFTATLRKWSLMFTLSPLTPTAKFRVVNDTDCILRISATERRRSCSSCSIDTQQELRQRSAAKRLLKEKVDILAPFLTNLFNGSLSTGVVAAAFKDEYITPLLKKPGMDSCEAKSYRPISNLSMTSTLLERLVAQQLTDYLTLSGLLPELQSAYRRHQ